MSGSDRTAFRTDCQAPVVRVPTPSGGESEFALPPERRDVLIDVIHDGSVIPDELLRRDDGSRVPDGAFLSSYELERDWGASMVAEELSRLLGLDHFLRVEIARVVMDFGRFPGVTPKDAEHLTRRAINYPFSDLLSYEKKRRVLEAYYDPISTVYEAEVSRARVKIAIHTYDTYNASGTLRPPMSVLTRSVGYTNHSEMPLGVFDPLYPDVLGEFTADRILRDRVSLTLEKAGLSTEHNFPYLMPDGSVEVRSQVWMFFSALKDAFERAFPERVDAPGYRAIWRMLLDTNLRSSESEALRSYIHLFRRTTDSRTAAYDLALEAYNHLRDWVAGPGRDFVEKYRTSPYRPSALGIEVRKDLVWDFDERGRPRDPRPEGARTVARVLAEALHTYFTVDRP